MCPDLISLHESHEDGSPSGDAGRVPGVLNEVGDHVEARLLHGSLPGDAWNTFSIGVVLKFRSAKARTEGIANVTSDGERLPNFDAIDLEHGHLVKRHLCSGYFVVVDCTYLP